MVYVNWYQQSSQEKLKVLRPDLYLTTLTCRSCFLNCEDLVHLYLCKNRRTAMKLQHDGIMYIRYSKHLIQSLQKGICFNKKKKTKSFVTKRNITSLTMNEIYKFYIFLTKLTTRDQQFLSNQEILRKIQEINI